MTHDRESLARALERIADEIEYAIAEGSSVHEQYVRLCEEHAGDDGWTSDDQARLRRTSAGLYAARLVVEQLRSQSVAAAQRFPSVDREGEALPLSPPSTDPAVVAEWWESLGPHDQAMVLERQTKWVGSADGLPYRVRHRANMMLLDAELEHRGHLLIDDPQEPLSEQEERVQRDVRGLFRIKALLSPDPPEDAGDLSGVTTPVSERFLYLFDADEYPLKTAILLGDLDRADHVVLHVPGATTTVDLRLVRELTWMSNLRTEAGRLLGRLERVAVLDWIGYQAPYDIATRRALGDSGVSVLVPGEASDERYARAAAPSLTRCADGLRHLAGPDVRLIASGHSYGASVFGLAMQHTDVFDAAMVAGCPGLFIHSMDELRLPPNSLYAAVAPGDVVALLNFFGIQVIQIPGVQILAPVPRTTSYPNGQRALLRLTVGHETYYDLGSVSLHGLAAIVVGDLNRVKTVSLAWLSRLTGIANNTTMPPMVVLGSGG